MEATTINDLQILIKYSFLWNFLHEIVMSSLNLNTNISLCDCGIACDVQFPSNVAEKAENKPHKNILSTTKSTQKTYYCNYTVRHFFFTAPLIHNIIVLFTSTGLLNFYELFDEKKKKTFCFF